MVDLEQAAPGSSFACGRMTVAGLAFFSLLLLFAGVNAAVWVSSDAILQTQIEIRKSAEHIRLIRELAECVRKSETAQRGYLLTGDRYLAPFAIGEKRGREIRSNPVTRGETANWLETASS